MAGTFFQGLNFPTEGLQQGRFRSSMKMRIGSGGLSTEETRRFNDWQKTEARRRALCSLTSGSCLSMCAVSFYPVQKKGCRPIACVTPESGR